MTPSLISRLRDPRDSTRRLEAAQALGELDDFKTAPLLIRAAVDDPDREVRAAARAALINLIGAETDLAIQTYRAEPDEDPWLVELEEEIDAVADADLSSEDDQYLTGLITILRNYPDPQMRLKAIQEMGDCSDLRVIAALAETVLWTDDEEVREVARASLEARFGEGTEEVIQSYQVKDYLTDEDDDEREEDQPSEPYHGYGMIEPPPPTRVQARYRAETTNPPLSSPAVEEGFPWVLAVIGAVGLVAMVIVVLLLAS